MEFIKKFHIQDDGSQIDLPSRIAAKYFALASLGALFTYVLESQSILFPPNSIKFKFKSIEGTMFIDSSSSRQLELICNAQNPQSKDHLFGVLDHTETPMGRRLLRASILQPLVSITTLLDESDIKARFQVVEILMQNPAYLEQIRKQLESFYDLEHLISAIIQVPQKHAAKYAEQAINRVILLKHIMKQTKLVANTIPDSTSELLADIQKVLLNVEIDQVLDLIDNVVDEHITYQKTPLGLRNQRCYAVLPGYNSLLDVARQTYKEAMDDVYELQKQYSDLMGFPVKLEFNLSVGFYLKIANEQIGDEPLLEEFINIVKRKGYSTCTTLKIMSQNERLKESQTEIYLMSEQYFHLTRIMGELILRLHEYLPLMYKISEAISLLDLLSCFASVSLKHDYVCPELGETLALHNAWHPILERISSTPIVKNDVFADSTLKMQFITGSNMSGKTVYLNQIAIIVIMAQMGCFVPCDYASIRITDKLLTRIGHDDDQQAQMSSFTQEIREIVFLLSQVTDRSLVIIDELGRGT
jgi:DNA mismatch repair protein MSH4